MEEPEFDASRTAAGLRRAENRQYLASCRGRTPAGELRVSSPRDRRRMADVALVLAPYGRPGAAVGVVGVLGPTRLRYHQAIGTVRFVSGLMNDLVDHLYA